MTTTKSTAPRPESVRLMLLAWSVAASIEVLHQLVQLVIAFFNRDALITQMKQSLAQTDNALPFSDALLGISANLALVGSTWLFLLVIGLLCFLLTRIKAQKKWAGGARRTWWVFSVYFGFRVFAVFVPAAGGSPVPDWLLAVNGGLQILVGVLAVMGLLFSMQDETLDFTGELQELRELEKELAEHQKKVEKQVEKQVEDVKK